MRVVSGKTAMRSSMLFVALNTVRVGSQGEGMPTVNWNETRVWLCDGSPTRRLPWSIMEVWSPSRGWVEDPGMRPSEILKGREMSDEELERWGVPKSDWESSSIFSSRTA
jgi:hypothetical protein